MFWLRNKKIHIENPQQMLWFRNKKNHFEYPQHIFWMRNKKIHFNPLSSKGPVCSCALEKCQKSVWHGNDAGCH